MIALEEAAFDYAEACKYDGGDKLLCVEHFKAGAKWQKRQIIEELGLSEFNLEALRLVAEKDGVSLQMLHKRLSKLFNEVTKP